jgi:phosphatidylglycerophosphatase A
MTMQGAQASRKTAFGSPSGFLAFGFGAGLVPLAPGTAGTAIAIPFAVALRLLDPLWFWAALMLLFALGVWCCGRASEQLGVHDHGGIVWDEMVGYWLAVALAPLEWQWFLAAFVLFRVFDIFKPWPVRQIDQRVAGGLGIMADDIVAGLYTLFVLAVLEGLAVF